MSASPTVAASSTKRPLEEPSSPSGPNDQPEAKRPALDKVVKDDHTAEDITTATPVQGDGIATEEDVKEEDVKAEEQPAVDDEGKDGQGDTVVTDAPAAQAPAVPGVDNIQPILSTSSLNGRPQANANHHQDESSWLHLRSVISTTEAATIIGKGGENVSQIRTLSGAKCTVSDYQRGQVERILTVSGPVDAVSKAYGLIVRTLNQENLDSPSTPQSRSYPMRLLIPNILIGSIIGKGGVRIREIQDVSNAKLNASDSMLPNSGERSLVVLGVADAVHIAVYYVAQTLVEQLTEKFGGPAASQYATRGGVQANMVPGGMSVQPYVPQAAGGQYGPPDMHRRGGNNYAQRGPPTQYSAMQGHHQPPHGQPPNMGYGAGSPARGYYGAPVQAAPQHPQAYVGHPSAAPVPHAAGPAAGPGGAPAMPGHPITQQIYIPNDMVGAIIGKGGAKINEIRQLSGSVIKINEPQDNSNERLVTITGTQECNQMALYMLYSRLESEKHRI